MRGRKICRPPLISTFAQRALPLVDYLRGRSLPGSSLHRRGDLIAIPTLIERAQQRAEKLFGITEPHQQAILSVGDQFGVTADPSGHDGQAACERFNQHIGHAFITGCETKKISGGKPIRNLFVRQ